MNQRTRSSLPLSPAQWRDSLTQEGATDAAIYLLALGGFYISYQVIYAACLRNSFPPDQAIVVAGLADLSILAYSWKAKQEVEQGRSAWGIRLLVMLMSLATFALNIADVWGSPLPVVLHALAPIAWIVGHEIMLRPKLRRARKRIREARIAAGLSPAPVARLRFSQWLFAPRRTFQVWKRMIMWSLDPVAVTRILVQQWAETKFDRKNNPKPIPAAWAFAVPSATEISNPEPAQALPPAGAVEPAETPSSAAPTLFATVKLKDAPAELQRRFDEALPEVPPPGRSAEDVWGFMTAAQDACNALGILYTDVIVAERLDCSKQYLSGVRSKQLSNAV